MKQRNDGRTQGRDKYQVMHRQDQREREVERIHLSAGAEQTCEHELTEIPSRSNSSRNQKQRGRGGSDAGLQGEFFPENRRGEEISRVKQL